MVTKKRNIQGMAIMFRYCDECGWVNSHHPNCPNNCEDDFFTEEDYQELQDVEYEKVRNEIDY